MNEAVPAVLDRSVTGPVRTAAQLVPSAVLTEVIDAFIYNMNDRQYLALAAGLLLLVSWTQNRVESRKGTAFLR